MAVVAAIEEEGRSNVPNRQVDLPLPVQRPRLNQKRVSTVHAGRSMYISYLLIHFLLYEFTMIMIDPFDFVLYEEVIGLVKCAMEASLDLCTDDY
ncbi:hypothetical protein HAX54_001302 [Datura stramonium]|uniref:Uncharacterized protein n=1 Tax=Datura stramonium TaxID=4076 RepID=A0ABS8RSD8_DATST|nr:hypothetical protein [Datura stramonium]